MCARWLWTDWWQKKGKKDNVCRIFRVFTIVFLYHFIFFINLICDWEPPSPLYKAGALASTNAVSTCQPWHQSDPNHFNNIGIINRSSASNQPNHKRRRQHNICRFLFCLNRIPLYLRSNALCVCRFLFPRSARHISFNFSSNLKKWEPGLTHPLLIPLSSCRSAWLLVALLASWPFGCSARYVSRLYLRTDDWGGVPCMYGSTCKDMKDICPHNCYVCAWIELFSFVWNAWLVVTLFVFALVLSA